jgi:hypothetical protein
MHDRYDGSRQHRSLCLCHTVDQKDMHHLDVCLDRLECHTKVVVDGMMQCISQDTWDATSCKAESVQPCPCICSCALSIDTYPANDGCQCQNTCRVTRTIRHMLCALGINF